MRACKRIFPVPEPNTCTQITPQKHLVNVSRSKNCSMSSDYFGRVSSTRRRKHTLEQEYDTVPSADSNRAPCLRHRTVSGERVQNRRVFPMLDLTLNVKVKHAIIFGPVLNSWLEFWVCAIQCSIYKYAYILYCNRYACVFLCVCCWQIHNTRRGVDAVW